MRFWLFLSIYSLLNVSLGVIATNIYFGNLSEERVTFDMVYEWKNNTSNSVNGAYRHPYYFCVKTVGRTPEEIAKTTFHELSHYFVMNNPEHFNYGVKK